MATGAPPTGGVFVSRWVRTGRPGRRKLRTRSISSSSMPQLGATSCARALTWGAYRAASLRSDEIFDVPLLARGLQGLLRSDAMPAHRFREE